MNHNNRHARHQTQELRTQGPEQHPFSRATPYEAHRERVRQIACPQCQAQPGQHCTNGEGRARKSNHRARVLAAKTIEHNRQQHGALTLYRIILKDTEDTPNILGATYYRLASNPDEALCLVPPAPAVSIYPIEHTFTANNYDTLVNLLNQHRNTNT